MAPAVTIALLFLVSQPTRQQFKLIGPTLLIYGLIGIFVIVQVKSKNLLGQAYEPMAADQISRLGAGFDPRFLYPLSILTQAFFFFKYLLLWIVPSPAGMSVDLYPAFALRLLSWPETLGFIGFVIYPFLAVRLLLRKGLHGLLGFALLCPWLLFATELTTVRIQESFVLYRSYLWLAGAFVALPFLCQKLTAKQAVYTLLFVAILMMPLSWLRLRTFSHPLMLWDDAARLIKDTDDYRPGMERIFYNRGTEFVRVKSYGNALEDFNKALKLSEEKGYLAGYTFYNRGGVYMVTGQYNKALIDYNRAIELGPENPMGYIGKAKALAALNDPMASKQAYEKACKLGSDEACKKN